MWPPIPSDSRLARTTIAIAFQRTRLLIRRSISWLPGSGVWSSGRMELTYAVTAVNGSDSARDVIVQYEANGKKVTETVTLRAQEDLEALPTTFAFGVPSVQDFVFVAFRLFNRSQFITSANAPSNPPGPYTLEDAILGIAIDPDVGGAGDDQITFFPDIGTMIYWDVNFSESGFVGTPGNRVMRCCSMACSMVTIAW